MKDFEALKSIWHDQVTLPKVGHEDVLKKIRKTRNGLSSRLLIEMIGMGIATAVITYVWIESPFKMWTTHLAMIIFIACCIYYILAMIDNYRIINDNKLIDKPEDYITYLKKYKHDRYIFNTRKYTIYSIFLTAGFLLYFVEISFMAPLWVTISGFVFTFVWIALCYFVLMRIYIKREESKLEDMIQNLERLQKQFEDNDL
jgi:Ca2+/Na+ antiporter